MGKETPAKRLIFSSLLLCLTIITVLNFQSVRAQEPTPSDDEVNAIARQMYCPICENTPLDVCPTEACHDWRELIRQMLAQGKTPDEIKQYFVDHYGARVLSEPPRTGFYWLLFVGPLVVILIIGFALFGAFYIWKKLSKKPIMERDAGSLPAKDAEYAARLEDELRRRK